MSDLIDRQAAIDVLMSLTIYKSKREIVQAADKDENGWIGGVAECIDEIEDLPSAQSERKKGKWLKVMEGNAYRDKCSRCLAMYPNAYGYKYCPNCGADMRGEQE